MNFDYSNLQAWDDEDGQAYVSGTHDVDEARKFYREVYLPETFGGNKDYEDSDERKWGFEVTEDEPDAVWVPLEIIENERWYYVYKEIRPNTVPVLIWRGR